MYGTEGLVNPMVDRFVTRKLAHAFPGSFINTSLEFIAHKEANEYFLLDDCESEFDVKCKVLEWLSRGAHKTCPFHSNTKNEKFHNFMLNGINDFLGTDFTEEDIAIIYQHFGNRVNHTRTEMFVINGCNVELLKGWESNE